MPFGCAIMQRNEAAVKAGRRNNKAFRRPSDRYSGRLKGYLKIQKQPAPKIAVNPKSPLPSPPPQGREQVGTAPPSAAQNPSAGCHRPDFLIQLTDVRACNAAFAPSPHPAFQTAFRLPESAASTKLKRSEASFCEAKAPHTKENPPCPTAPPPSSPPRSPR